MINSGMQDSFVFSELRKLDESEINYVSGGVVMFVPPLLLAFGKGVAWGAGAAGLVIAAEKALQ